MTIHRVEYVLEVRLVRENGTWLEPHDHFGIYLRRPHAAYIDSYPSRAAMNAARDTLIPLLIKRAQGHPREFALAEAISTAQPLSSQEHEVVETQQALDEAIAKRDGLWKALYELQTSLDLDVTAYADVAAEGQTPHNQAESETVGAEDMYSPHTGIGRMRHEPRHDPAHSTWVRPKGRLTIVAETRRGPVKICELMPQATDHRDRAYHEEAHQHRRGPAHPRGRHPKLPRSGAAGLLPPRFPQMLRFRPAESKHGPTRTKEKAL